MSAEEKLTGMQKLREAVNLFNGCNESFNDQFDPKQLLQLYEMYVKSGWTFSPDQWEDWQVKDALKGIAPDWNDDETPKRPKRTA